MQGTLELKRLTNWSQCKLQMQHDWCRIQDWLFSVLVQCLVITLISLARTSFASENCQNVVKLWWWIWINVVFLHKQNRKSCHIQMQPMESPCSMMSKLLFWSLHWFSSQYLFWLDYYCCFSPLFLCPPPATYPLMFTIMCDHVCFDYQSHVPLIKVML